MLMMMMMSRRKKSGIKTTCGQNLQYCSKVKTAGHRWLIRQNKHQHSPQLRAIVYTLKNIATHHYFGICVYVFLGFKSLSFPKRVAAFCDVRHICCTQVCLGLLTGSKSKHSEHVSARLITHVTLFVGFIKSLVIQRSGGRGGGGGGDGCGIRPPQCQRTRQRIG